MKMKTYITSAMLAAKIYAEGSTEFDYMDNGTSWPDLCQTGLEQSPIDFNYGVLFPSDNKIANSVGWSDTNELPINLPILSTN